VRAPLSFTCGNWVFGETLDDAWAAFRLGTFSYKWLSGEAKRTHMLALRDVLRTVEADVQILRVSRGWDRAGYLRDAGRSSHRAHAGAVRSYLAAQAYGAGARTRVFLLVSLREAERDVESYLSALSGRLSGVGGGGPRELLGAVRCALSARGRRSLSGPRIERLSVRAEQVGAVLGQLSCARPASPLELQWLARRAFCRGVGEPPLDRNHEPRSLMHEVGGGAQLAPLADDTARWMDSLIEDRGRSLRLEAPAGEGWQAQLVLGALPEQAVFPGERAELMFAPAESLSFPIDLSLTARFLANERAVRMARRRVQDADQVAGAESDGEQGLSDLAYRRTQHARDLLDYLQAPSRPPLLRGSLAIAVGASTEAQLEERVEACRRAFADMELHRPLGCQMQLFVQHLPGQRTRVRGYEDTLTIEQVAAMIPSATHAVGSRGGFYLGSTLSGSQRPVRFDLREGSRGNRNTAILSIGALGSGKTTLTQKLQYEGFLQGARIVDCDPKGDHRLHLLDEVAPHAEVVELQPDAGLRGMLDPLRIAPEQLRREAAVSFLCDLLPAGFDPAWQLTIVAAVDRVLRRSGPTLLEVVRALLEGDAVDAQVGRALEVYAHSGITQLGFADPQLKLPGLGEAQVTYIPIRDLPGPDPGTPRAEYTQSERVGQQIVRLIAMFAMQLLARERGRLKLFAFDEGWRLLGDPVGRTLLASLQRMGRSELAVPIMSTQLVTDALVGERESLENLLGATFVFGMRSSAEAARALALLGIDPEEDRALRLLLELDAGRCLMRDHYGRVEAVQVELAGRALLRACASHARDGSAT
jgi:AAA domain-containing protein